MGRRFKKWNGRHAYNGKSTSRGSRLISKLSKGMSKGNLTKVFAELEKEKSERKEEV